ncbi:MAG: hypothetical protein KGJ60_09590 [Verrucomicrobiota bacterium]|nr:hypothetical protein [Verrucomicrobiota bacterium]
MADPQSISWKIPRKLMSLAQLLEFLPAESPEQLAESDQILARSMEGEDGAWIQRGVDQGWYRVTETHSDGRPRYRYVWHISDQNFLVVNASMFIGQPGDNDDWLWMIGAELIARENRCRGIEFMTKRRGHVIQAQRAGFKVTGLTLQKTMEHCPA